MQAIALYRGTFRPSAQLAKPYVMLGFNVFAADTDAEAQLAGDLDAAGLRQPAQRPARRSCRRRVAGYLEPARPAGTRACSTQVLSCSAIGSPDTVRRELRGLHRSAPAPTS